MKNTRHSQFHYLAMLQTIAALPRLPVFSASELAWFRSPIGGK